MDRRARTRYFFRIGDWLTLGMLCTVAFMGVASARADIYTRVDERGVVHFTNIPDRRERWKRIMRTGPGKALSLQAPRRSLRLSPERLKEFDTYIEEAARVYNIPEALIRAVIHVESDYNHRAISSAGAIGLMQLMPRTAESVGVSDPFDPRENIAGGTRYLRMLANQFRGDLKLTLAAYHAGPGAVTKYQGIPPYQTTRAYVEMVISLYRQKKGNALVSNRG